MRSVKRLLFSMLLSIGCVVPMLASVQDYSVLKSRLEKLSSGMDARVGIAVIVDGKDTICVNNNYQYPMMSVYKFHQAVAVAYILEKREISLDSMIFVKKEDLRPDTYSPFRDKYPDGNALFSIKDLLTYTLQLSDNNACDILFDRVLDVTETDAVLRELGMSQFNISATELEMQRDKSKCHENWSTPLSTVKLIDDFVAGRIVKGAYYDFILRTMLTCTTGEHRLPALLPKSVVGIGHKTGTSGLDKSGKFIGVNDVGFVLLPFGSRYSIAVYITDSHENLDTNEKIIADISSELYSFLEKSHKQ